MKKTFDDRIGQLEHKAAREERERIDSEEWRNENCWEIRHEMIMRKLKRLPGTVEMLTRIEDPARRTAEDVIILKVIEELENLVDDDVLLELEIQHRCLERDIPLDLPVYEQVSRIDAAEGSAAWRQICKQRENQDALEYRLGIIQPDGFSKDLI